MMPLASKAAALAASACLVYPAASAAEGSVWTTMPPPPEVTYLSVTSGVQGTELSIYGTDFMNVLSVDFGDVPVEQIGGILPGYEVKTPEWIATDAPRGSGTVDVTVVTAEGTSSPGGVSDEFTYLAPPPLAASPSAAPQASASELAPASAQPSHVGLRPAVGAKRARKRHHAAARCRRRRGEHPCATRKRRARARRKRGRR
jgi:hypothetical protein